MNGRTRRRSPQANPELAVQESSNLDEALVKVDVGMKKLNYFVGFSVLIATLGPALYYNQLDHIGSALIKADPATAWRLANEYGLIEKLPDSFIHLFNGKFITKDSSTWLIMTSMLLDATRLVMAHEYGAAGSSIPAFLNVVDVGVFHPSNLVANGARCAGKFLKAFSMFTRSAEPATAETPTHAFARPSH